MENNIRRQLGYKNNFYCTIFWYLNLIKVMHCKEFFSFIFLKIFLPYSSGDTTHFLQIGFYQFNVCLLSLLFVMTKMVPPP